MLKDELEAIINSDNGWSVRSTLILAIGILGEYVALPVFENAKTSLVGSFLKSRKPSELKSIIHWWQKKLKIVFALMVVGGVVGEYEFSSRIARNAERLQQISDDELGIASTKAADAIERAERLRKDNLLLQSEVVRLELRTVFRHLTTEQKRVIGDKMKPFSGLRFSMGIFNVGDDGEAIEKDITAMLSGPQGAGWILGTEGITSESSPEAGILIAVNPEATAFVRKAANELAEALRREGLFVPPVRTSPYPANLKGATNPTKGDIGISIGRRP